MELVRKNIHMDRIKCRANTQIAMEDDVNISDNKPDAAELIANQGSVKIEEIKTTEDHVNIKGKLNFSVMYLSKEGERRFYRMDGAIPLEEQVYMEGVRSGDFVNVTTEIEDLRIGMINSRKLSVQALVSHKAAMEEFCDEETAVELCCDEPVEYRKQTISVSEIAMHKKDIFRIKEEIPLLQNLPNIFQLVWSSIEPVGVTFKLMGGKVSVQGELLIFFIYEGEDGKYQWHETTRPFSGEVDCHGCTEAMIPNIRYTVGHKETEVRPDFDGEERIIGIEMVLDLDIKLYEENTIDILADVYGVSKEIAPVLRAGTYRNILIRNCGKNKVSDKLKLKNNGARILQVCHSDGTVRTDKMEIVENGIQIKGTLDVCTLYVTSEDEMPFASMKGEIPFSYLLETPGITDGCTYDVEVSVEQLQVSMADSEELDVKAVLSFNGIVFGSYGTNWITDITVEELDLNKLNSLPGIVGYVVKEGDTLWQIGRKYYVSVDSLKEMNALAGDEIRPGDKILIVK